MYKFKCTDFPLSPKLPSALIGPLVGVWVYLWVWYVASFLYNKEMRKTSLLLFLMVMS